MALFDAFLKIDGIEGESQDAKHKSEIQLESFSWGAEPDGHRGRRRRRVPARSRCRTSTSR